MSRATKAQLEAQILNLKMQAGNYDKLAKECYVLNEALGNKISAMSSLQAQIDELKKANDRLKHALNVEMQKKQSPVDLEKVRKLIRTIAASDDASSCAEAVMNTLEFIGVAK